jgi:hypothetical protein
MDGWIKIHRKLRNHAILRDPTALQIFMWILICVDYKTGKMVSGRFWAADELKMKPRTFHKALTERLRDRYDLVTLSSDNKNTTIYVKNWKKYQQFSDTSSDTSVTPKGQQSDTKQEDKEVKKHISITELGDSHFERIAELYGVPISFVRSKYDDMVIWHESSGKNKKDWIATLRGFVKKDSIKIRQEAHGKSNIGFIKTE